MHKPARTPLSSRRQLRVALVEDSIDILESLAAALSMQGIEVVFRAETSDAAVDWLATNALDCDVIVIDIFLRVGSGLSVLKRLSSLEHPPLAIVLSNYATDNLRQQCEALGAAKIFDKASEVEKMMGWLLEYSAALAQTRSPDS